MRQGNFSQVSKPLTNANGQNFPNNQIPTSALSPQALRLLQYMPLPNLAGITNNYEANFPNNDTYNQTIDRIDQNIGDKVRLYFPLRPE